MLPRMQQRHPQRPSSIAEGDLYVAECPELGTVSQGPSIEAGARESARGERGSYLEEAGEPVPIAPALLTTFTVTLTRAEAA